MNEFGEIDIDGQIVDVAHSRGSGNNRRSFVLRNCEKRNCIDVNSGAKIPARSSLKNECICCEMNGPFVDTLLGILEHEGESDDGKSAELALDAGIANMAVQRRSEVDHVVDETAGVADTIC